jgi:hypothetical protein
MAVKDVIFIGETFVSGSPSGKGDVILSVEQNGDLRWYCYFGNGKEDVTGNTGWHRNSGNTIGNGWNGLSHLVGATDGILLGVDDRGDLRWYRYEGMGEHNPEGNKNWNRNSGNRIGNGWNGLEHIFAYPAFHPEGLGAHQIFAVLQDGNLRWFGYMGNGEDDVTGNTGWHPKSRIDIGNGWNGLQFLVAGGGVHFGVPQSGPNNGNLLWYRYIGKGDGDVSGAIGWSQNSGNPIGNGWNGLRHLFAAGHPGGHGGSTLYGIEQNGDLRFFNYHGQGESDLSGNTGYHVNSGNRIGNGW